jgi:hypothetical protein
MRTPISPNHSFSTSTFVDNKGDKAEAIQERTLGIIMYFANYRIHFSSKTFSNGLEIGELSSFVSIISAINAHHFCTIGLLPND